MSLTYTTLHERTLIQKSTCCMFPLIWSTKCSQLIHAIKVRRLPLAGRAAASGRKQDWGRRGRLERVRTSVTLALSQLFNYESKGLVRWVCPGCENSLRYTLRNCVLFRFLYFNKKFKKIRKKKAQPGITI